MTTRVLAALALAVSMALAITSPATAHSEIVLASPAPGTGLPQAPGAVVLRFTEPLNLALSHIDVLDAAGSDAGVGPTLAVEGDPRAMRRKLGLLPVGQYVVAWTTVSTLDGHTLKGSYNFAIGTAASGVVVIAASPLASEGPLGLLGRFAALLGLALWAGWVVLGGVAVRAGLDPRSVRWLGRAGPLAAAAGTALAMASSALVAAGTLTAIGGVVASPSGQLRLLVLAAATVGALVGPRLRPLQAVVVLVAIVAEATSGHAAASPIPLVAGVTFAVHLGAVGVWVFAIVASALARDRLRDVLAAFTPYAVGAAVVVTISGTANAAAVLNGPGDLIDTDYGRTLLLKMGAFGAMAAFGYLHFRRRHRADVSNATLLLPVRWEFAAALVALAVATTLVGFPNPPREAESAETLSGIDPVLGQLGEREAVSVADASGPFVVGLTILPPRPGPVEVRVQVLGVEAGDGLRDARLVGSSGESCIDVALAPCGLGCFAGPAGIDVAGDWRFVVSIISNRGPLRIAQTIPLPTPDGTPELAAALLAMERLRTAHLDERLKGSVDGPQVDATYTFEAPDRMEIQVNGSDRIIIGERDYSRSSTNEAWKPGTFPAPGFSWPLDFYREFWRGAMAVRLLGEETVDGVPTRIVAFVRPDLPLWFRLWVGVDDGLVRRMEMQAEGHLMDHAYSDFDGPISIEPPP